MGFVVSKLAAETVATNLAKPNNSIGGRLIGNIIKKANATTEKTAVRLCNIQPDYHVLEVGFGPGVGLQHAYNFVKDGSGIIHGVEISDRMMKQASDMLQHEIKEGKVILYQNSVTELQFEDSTFDCIFHVNCYYFWPDMDAATKELHRVIKPGGLMVAVRNIKQLDESAAKGYMKYTKTDPQPYMDSMERNGFVDIRDEYVNKEGSNVNDEESRTNLKAIFGTAKK